MTEKPSREADPPVVETRRAFFERLTSFLCASTFGMAFIGMVRSVLPWALPDPSRRFKIGSAGDYAVGAIVSFEKENVLVFRDERGLYAISTVCTHLGCIVSRLDSGFQCPCHGSRFSGSGAVVQGPAPKGLAWLRIVAAPGGQLMVDPTRVVSPGTRYMAGIEQV